MLKRTSSTTRKYDGKVQVVRSKELLALKRMIFRFAHDRWNRGETKYIKIRPDLLGFLRRTYYFLIFALATCIFHGSWKTYSWFPHAGHECKCNFTALHGWSTLFWNLFKFFRIWCKNFNFCYDRNTGNHSVEYKSSPLYKRVLSVFFLKKN